MADLLPRFDAPPVVETVLSVQFEKLPDFTGAFVGWFWKSYLSRLPGEWQAPREVHRLVDQFERFGAEVTWGRQGLEFSPAEPSTRAQFVRADETRMIQVQDSRLVLNWKKKAEGYPSYDVLLPEFLVVLETFRTFLHDAGCGEPKYNQWEVTYVNHIRKGEGWNSAGDLRNIFKDIDVSRIESPISAAESVSATWRYLINDNQGRLHVTLTHVRVPPEDKEAMRLQLLARGPIDKTEAVKTLTKYFDLGHQAIDTTFVAVTTPSAHKMWKRTQ